MTYTESLDRLDFGNSIVGFEQLRYFALEKIEGDNPFYLLKSVDDSQLEFVVLSPFEIDRQYQIELTEDLKQELRIEMPEQVLVLNIVTVHKPFTESTVNLMAPLIINVSNGLSRQVILGGSVYQTRTRLFPSDSKGE